jgi:7-dehydrocholesterol reductase
MQQGTEIQFAHAKPGIGKSLFALFLMIATPTSAMLIWHTLYHLDGSITALFMEFGNAGVLEVFQKAWFDHFWGSATAWTILGVYIPIQILMMKLLPGKPYMGPVTPMGNVPQYKDNGLLSFILTIGLFLGASLGMEWFPVSILYHHFGELLAALNVFALTFCLMLYFKGRFAPSSTDASTSGNVIFDYYWGTELYPRFWGIDVKMLTNCFAQREILGHFDPAILVTSGLLVMYLTKFFIWESGYMRSTDIITDRAGYYICWGCLVWVPAVYSSPAFFMVNHHGILPIWAAVVIFILGTIGIWMNYWADHQRMAFRKANGDIKIWGKQATFIRAEYTTGTGEVKENLLLTSGFWGLARHFHYIPELAAAAFWSCTAGFGWFLPWFYFLFLTILLVQRTFRDDEKCAAKYGKYWDAYRQKVRYRLIPGVF